MSREYHDSHGYWDNERQASVFVPAFGGGKIIREQRHVPEWGAPYGDFEGFITKLRKLAEGLDNPTIAWHKGHDDEGPSLFIQGERPRTAADDEWLKEAKARQDERDKRDVEYLTKRIARSPLTPWEGLEHG